MAEKGIKKGEKVIQLVVFKDQLVGLSDAGSLVKFEEYTEVQGEERAPSIDEKRKGLEEVKSRWSNL